MSESHEQFEDHLRSLRPIDPSMRLEAALDRELAEPAGFPREKRRPSRLVTISLWTSWGITAVAAAIVFAALSGDRPGGSSRVRDLAPPPAQREVLSSSAHRLRVTPVSAEGILYEADFEGIVYLEDGVPARRMRYQFIDTVEMRAQDGAASVAFTYPREEIRFIPINAY